MEGILSWYQSVKLTCDTSAIQCYDVIMKSVGFVKLCFPVARYGVRNDCKYPTRLQSQIHKSQRVDWISLCGYLCGFILFIAVGYFNTFHPRMGANANRVMRLSRVDLMQEVESRPQTYHGWLKFVQVVFSGLMFQDLLIVYVNGSDNATRKDGDVRQTFSYDTHVKIKLCVWMGVRQREK